LPKASGFPGIRVVGNYVNGGNVSRQPIA
jgi:hypothetical protein